MRDEDGYLEAGDLGGGAYAAMEGDLGEVLRPLAGFGRDLAPIQDEEEEIWDDSRGESADGEDIWPGVIFTPEDRTSTQTSPGAVVYEVKFQ